MTSAAHRPAPDRPATPIPARGGAHVAWLPRVGIGNGVDTDAWAPALEVTGPVAVRLLDALPTTGVAAFAAPVRPGPDDVWRLWIGTGRYLTAQDTLRTVLPAILVEHPDGLR